MKRSLLSNKRPMIAIAWMPLLYALGDIGVSDVSYHRFESERQALIAGNRELLQVTEYLPTEDGAGTSQKAVLVQ